MKGLAPVNLARFQMPSTSRIGAKEARLAPFLSGAAGRARPLRILFVHSKVADLDRCVRELKNADFKVSTDLAADSAQFAKRLRSKFYDIVVAEYPTRNWSGPPVLDVLHELKQQIPLIFVSEALQLETVAELISRGASDCVEMGHIGHLPVAIRRALSANNLREERDLAESSLRHSEARYRALVGNLTYGICRCSTEGKFLDVNPALVAMLGFPSKEEVLATNLATEIFCDPGKRAQLLGHSGKRDQSDCLEVDWKRKDGRNLKVRLSGREVNTEAGRVDAYEIIAEDVTKQRELEERLRLQAAKDPLTGLANYRQLVDVLDAEIKRSERTGREFALLLFDLDGLKQINDRYGHMTGSQALCRLADVLCISCRDLDTAARFGGDEFALVLPETGGKSASMVAERICRSFANDGRKPKLTVSVGIAIYPKDGEKLKSLLEAADMALYAMKARVHKRAPATPKSIGKSA
jgi:diguanylate cyclase (GGDEF)-like protein/PAS domain S-box-containing protein